MRILNHLWGPVIIISETFELLYAETYACYQTEKLKVAMIKMVAMMIIVMRLAPGSGL